MPIVENPAPGLFILGMHRSGTSCLAGMLHCAGFNVGPVDEWNPDNRKGNREHLAVTPLNEAVLSLAGGSWDQPPAHGAARVDKRRRREMNAIIEGLEAGGKPWLIKDPRILLIPEPWLSLRGDARRLGIFRHPLAVARSLQQRNRMNPNHAVQLWVHYNRALLELQRAQPFPLMLFTPDPGHLTRSLESALTAQFATHVSREEIAPGKAAAFFSAELVHHDPDLFLDLEPALLGAGIDSETRTQANRLWQNLVQLQNPHPLPLAATPGAAEAQTASLTTSEQITDPELALAQGRDPVPLIRDRIRALQAQGAQRDLLEWLRGWHQRLPDDPFITWELASVEWDSGLPDAAMRHAKRAVQLAPGWVVPLSHIAEWAEQNGNWQVAAQSYRQLLSAHRSLASSPRRTAQLFFDQGEGFTGQNSLTLPIETDGRRLELRFDAGEFGRNATGLRLDPANQQVVVTDLALTVTDTTGRTLTVPPTGDNALLHLGQARFFDTDDPQLLFEVLPGEMQDIAQVTAGFRIAHADEEVQPALLRTMLKMRSQLSDAEALQQLLETLEERTQAFESAWRHVRGSTGSGLPDPAGPGRPVKALDELEERWRSLESALRSLGRRRR